MFKYFFAGMALTLSFSAAMASSELPLPLPQQGAKVSPQIHFIEGADLQLFKETYARSLSQQRQELVDQAASLMYMGATGPDAVKMLIAFDRHILDLRNSGRNRLGPTLEASFKAALDQLYRKFEPTQRKLQFTQCRLESDCDFAMVGTYSVRPSKDPGLILTLTLVHLHTGETQTFSAAGDSIYGTLSLAKQVFHDYQKTRFPLQVNLFGKSLTVITQGSIQRPGGSQMAELYQQAETACQIRGGRLSSEDELSALGTLGDYQNGVSLGQDGETSNFWAIKSRRVYVAPWSRATELTSLNPTAQLNYLCIR